MLQVWMKRKWIKEVCSLMSIRAWPQLQLKRTKKGNKDVYLIDDTKESWLPQETPLKFWQKTAKFHKNVKWMTTIHGIPPQPVHWVSVPITRITSLSNSLSDQVFGAVTALAPTKKNVVTQMTAVDLLLTFHTAGWCCMCVCSHPGHHLFDILPYGGATGHWEDFKDLSYWTWCLTSTFKIYFNNYFIV